MISGDAPDRRTVVESGVGAEGGETRMARGESLDEELTMQCGAYLVRTVHGATLSLGHHWWPPPAQGGPVITGRSSTLPMLRRPPK